jgi:hypothetical protein
MSFFLATPGKASGEASTASLLEMRQGAKFIQLQHMQLAVLHETRKYLKLMVGHSAYNQLVATSHAETELCHSQCVKSFP